METVQIQCGSCQRLMAVQVEHLGSQVHCPHCQAIVQAPPRSATRAAGQRTHEGDIDSIFAGPGATDDIFGSGPHGPAVEMPPERISPPVQDQVLQSVAALSGKPEAGNPKADPISDPTTHASDSPFPPALSASAENLTDEAGLAAIEPRRLVKRSALAAVLLIFLVPYALLATGVIAYLLINQSRPIDPLERLPDPYPKNGGPRYQEKRAQHDAALPNKLKTRLHQPLAIGALQVTPVKVQLSSDGLVLHLKMKNMSTDQVFNPVSHEFMKFAGEARNASPPYTYLNWTPKKIYGGEPQWFKGPQGKEEPTFDGDIGPGQEELVRIATLPRYRDDVKRIADSREPLVWRVQVRRGFVAVRDTQVSATAVIGVEFSPKDIDKES